MQDRRLIEETFPVREVSEESAKEKSIRHSHISTLHTWWARRPLASSRATNYASLIPSTNDPIELEQKRQFIIKLSRWKNSLDHRLLEKARKDILDANGGKPKVLDPFAGGGALPLEALRLGCETYAGDYNPVANLILKCTLEYPQRYGAAKKNKDFGLVSDKKKNQLLEDVNRWGKWILEEASQEIGKFYPADKEGYTPVGYIWARTITCQNPACNSEIPLITQYWLAKHGTDGVAIFPYVEQRQLKLRIVGRGYEKMPKGFDPNKGTVSKAVASCLICGSTVDDKTTRRLFIQGKSNEKMIAVISYEKGKSGKKYRISNEGDLRVFKHAESQLHHKRKLLLNEWGLDPVPDEDLPKERVRGFSGFRIILYGMQTWGDIFNARQKLTLITFLEKIKKAHLMMSEKYDEEYATVVTTYLAFGLDRLAEYGSSLCRLNPTGGRGVVNTFGRQALPMVWTYAESNPFNPAGAGWPTACEKNEKWIEHASQSSDSVAKIVQSSATSLPYADEYFDAIFTDPPYYDNIAYADLSDFFYVWLKRSVGNLYPDLFSTPITPKAKEIIKDPGRSKDDSFFEDMLRKSFKEINRVLKPHGIATIVYAHKSTAGWETLINSILDSGLVVTGAWPLNTEKTGRLVAQETASLASSICMIARKLKKTKTGFYREVKIELSKHLNEKLERLWKEGISGADFFISSIGSSIEVFGKYEKIIDDEGNIVRADKLLDEVRKIVTDYAVKHVLHNGFAGDITALARFYVLWRWAYGDARVSFDDAHKLAQSVGIDLAHEWNKGFIVKDKEFINILGPDDRKLEELKNSKELIDVLHAVLLLWKKGKNEDVVNLLKESGFGKTDVFYRVAQAISESLPNESKEKKLLEGFLAGKERLAKDVRKDTGQRRLFE